MITKTEIVVIGAGAAGLMAARELTRAGKRVVIVEARDRIGGRVWSLPENDFGYLAQAGAEFVHGSAPITKSLIREARLTFVPTDGEVWNSSGGKLTHEDNLFTPDISFMPDLNLLRDKLRALKEDLPIAKFLEQNFSEERYTPLRNSVIKMVEGYDAADPNTISAFALREEWLGGQEWQQGRIQEGYGALLSFLETECRKKDATIKLDQKVTAVAIDEQRVEVTCASGERYEAEQVIVTVPLPLLASISFSPAISEKVAAATKIGFGQVIKVLLSFKSQWWANASGKDLRKLVFMRSDEMVPIWWTQYPESQPLLTGWLAGPKALQFKDTPEEEILSLALSSLENIFKVERKTLEQELIRGRVFNWTADPYAQGAYSYSTIESDAAYAELQKPIGNFVFFAGEAVYIGNESNTVEGALASGQEVAAAILNNR